jgi:hypothetical protein
MMMVPAIMTGVESSGLFRIQRRSRLNRRAMDRLVSEDLMVGMDQPDEAMPGLVPH